MAILNILKNSANFQHKLKKKDGKVTKICFCMSQKMKTETIRSMESTAKTNFKMKNIFENHSFNQKLYESITNNS